MPHREPPHSSRPAKEGWGDRRADMEWRQQSHSLSSPVAAGVPWTNPSLLETHPHLGAALSGLVAAQQATSASTPRAPEAAAAPLPLG